MSTIGFTGTRQFTVFDMVLIKPITWEWLEAYDVYVTGACIGFDAIMGAELASRFPRKEHVVYVPANRSQVDPWWDRRRVTVDINVVEMPEGTDYRARNSAIVLQSSALFYAANRPELHRSQRRSGTWMTVRMARNNNLLISGVVLHPEEENDLQRL